MHMLKADFTDHVRSYSVAPCLPPTALWWLLPTSVCKRWSRNV